MNHMPLSKEDYEEPRCPLCLHDTPAPVPQQRIREKLDEYMARRDYAGAERHLTYWLAEAQQNGDLRGEFFLRGEMMGHYRKTGNREKAMESARESMRLMELMEYGQTLSAATACINAATVYDAFGEPAQALPLFIRAQGIYEQSLPAEDPRLGGLYNNMGLAYMALGRFQEAESAFARALAVMEQVQNGQNEQAITYLNMANLLEAEQGLEQAEAAIGAYLDKAAALLNDPALPHDGYHAFVCEKCAPTFDYYGYFLAAAQFNERAKEIYERA